MPETDPETIIQVLGPIALAIIAAVIGAKKLLKDWNSDTVETSVITLMHEELERMSKQNKELSVELGKLQIEITNLNRELHKLNLENQRLQIEVIALTREVTRLQTALHKGTTDESTS